MTLNAVVLPAPFGPIRPEICPASTSNETPSRATMPPKRKVISRTDSNVATEFGSLLRSSGACLGQLQSPSQGSRGAQSAGEADRGGEQGRRDGDERGGHLLRLRRPGDDAAEPVVDGAAAARRPLPRTSSRPWPRRSARASRRSGGTGTTISLAAAVDRHRARRAFRARSCRPGTPACCASRAPSSGCEHAARLGAVGEEHDRAEGARRRRARRRPIRPRRGCPRRSTSCTSSTPAATASPIAVPNPGVSEAIPAFSACRSVVGGGHDDGVVGERDEPDLDPSRNPVGERGDRGARGFEPARRHIRRRSSRPTRRRRARPWRGRTSPRAGASGGRRRRRAARSCASSSPATRWRLQLDRPATDASTARFGNDDRLPRRPALDPQVAGEREQRHDERGEQERRAEASSHPRADGPHLHLGPRACGVRSP